MLKDSEVRTEIVRFRTTKKEKAYLLDKAGNDFRTLSQYLRFILLKGVEKQ